ncbi:conserved hypothetical protein [Brugia malayi]|uniref:Bm10250 n=1 Tax=Brugia malayi TaxID=6279 RepID=A0A0K0IML4_BRUMA|nr:uncharacterized protein BM_BM10250 [Brugia malayi]CTP81417.1 Bm10250 [Brugia malayi]VIO92853.1 conserved hypothetical protein [Brugia malayi]
MSSALILLLASFLIIQPGNTKFVEYCISDAQCDPGERCVPEITGLMLCQQALEQMPTTPTIYPAQSRQITCQNDAQCRVLGKCIYLGWPGSCQYASLGWKLTDRCYNDADCAQHLHCINTNGMMTCQVVRDALPYKTCQSNTDCGLLEMCSFSKQYNANACIVSIDYPTAKMSPFRSDEIGGGAVPLSLTDNRAISKGYEKQCTADYQCSVFEICSEESVPGIPGNRICTYNPTTSNRQCRFNADCQSGQRCEKVLENFYLCKAAKQTTFMQPCQYDYECSGGQRCINISNGISSYQQNSRYCFLLDERSNCDNDMDCSDAKVCNTFGKFKQCVPITSNSHFKL